MGVSGRRYRLGFDIGGTFTDFVLLDVATSRIRLHKVLTTPDDPAVGALAGITEIVAAEGISLAQVREMVHGTTLVTNAMIERKGAPIGLLTTMGFRDVLEMGSEQRYDIYDLFLKFPQPLVPRSRRLEVVERIAADGDVVVALHEESALEAVQALVDDGVEAVAVCYMHAYRNPAHERRTRELINRQFPRLYVSLSSEVVPEIAEYQRVVTTAANAYVQPRMDVYLDKLATTLAERGFRGDLRLMHSAGGLISLETARCFPMRLLESGPAGGALATTLFARLAGVENAIAFDMGGTTAKTCLIENGRAEIAPMTEAGREHRFKKGSGLPIKAPAIEMIEIGAGGGSIATIDEIGLMKVGPESAGANPGPACYALGGVRPTITDANVALGYYDPDHFLGGRMRLDPAAAETALATVGGPLGLDVIGAASGIRKLVSEAMASAARVHLIERGRDPRRYAMVAFGGAGPAFAAAVARHLGIARVIIPPASGAASALGFLAAPLSFEQVRSYPTILDDRFRAEPVAALLAELEAAGRGHLASAGVADAITVERRVDVRLAGQLHLVSVDLPDGPIDDALLAELRRRFAAAYLRRYAQTIGDDALIEILSFHVVCAAPAPKVSVDISQSGAVAASRKATRRAWFEGGFVDTTVHDRRLLKAGDVIEGPAIIEEPEATTLIPPNDTVTVDAVGNLDIAIRLDARQRTAPATNSAEEAARIEADPIGLEIMWSRLVTIAEEMALTIMRTAFSLTISDAQDFGCALLDARGETLAHSPRTMPVFNQTLPRAAKAAIAEYREELEPGDVLITNDPWLCAGHLFDIAIVTPLFRDGRLVAILGTVGHVTDIGGTKDSLRAREIFEEGIQIPPLKLVKAGVPNRDVYRMIGENVRHSGQVVGDINSLVAANAIGGQRLLEFMDEYGIADFAALAGVLRSRAEGAARTRVRALPDGVYESEVWNNPLGTMLRYPVKVTIAGDTIDVDFAGVPPQQPMGGINCTLNYTTGHVTYPLKCLLTPNVRGNVGCIQPITVRAPKGSILSCEKPASVAIRTRTGWYIAPNLFQALAPAAPDAVQAATGLPVAIGVYGEDASGHVYSDMLLFGGGQGASAHGDGRAALIWPSSAAAPSIEMFEARVPILVVEKSLVPDSGGAGRFRGGLATRVRLRKRHDDGRETLVSLYPEGVDLHPPGLFGGLAGAAGKGGVRNAETGDFLDCRTGELVSLISVKQIVELDIAGGAGFGPPAERDRRALANDLREGYVTESEPVRTGLAVTPARLPA